MLDLKQIDPEIHKVLVGIPNTKTLKFARYLAERNQPTRVRYVVVPATPMMSVQRIYWASLSVIWRMSKVVCFCRITNWRHKWALCGDEYKLKGVHPPPKETILKIKEILESYGKNIIY